MFCVAYPLTTAAFFRAAIVDAWLTVLGTGSLLLATGLAFIFVRGRVPDVRRHGFGRATWPGSQLTGRDRGRTFTAHNPEFMSTKNTCPLYGCAPHTLTWFL